MDRLNTARNGVNTSDLTDDLLDGFGDRLAEARAKTGLSMQEVIDELEGTGIGPKTRGSLSNYERGKSLPRADYLLWLCARANVTPDWVLSGEPPVKWNRQSKATATRRATAALLHRIADWLLGDLRRDEEDGDRWYEQEALLRVMDAPPRSPESIFVNREEDAGNGS